ncbi:hypothetical protein SKAU_G00060040 [Synaphobranchus kaupii]|uniref:Peptidase A2 domain-containing protein n=1 Tax=Synaphobranchus kaupii TaxID=118154 RepID=A0A9Q1G4N9_SYNKA|nr:hypothetical protein SKAU_G00060040 [Synaphobranchus kaupii]
MKMRHFWAVGAGSDRLSTATLNLFDQNIQFKIDTGADITIIPESLYHQLSTGPLLHTAKVLQGPSQTPLNVRGCPALTVLGLVIRPTQHGVHAVSSDLEQEVKGTFPNRGQYRVTSLWLKNCCLREQD